MDKSKAREWAELAVRISEEGQLGQTSPVSDAEDLLRMSHRLQKIHETQCNYGDTDKLTKRMARLRGKVMDTIEGFGWKINHFNSDPRGFAVYVNLPSGKYNSFGGSENGWGF